MSEIFEFDPVLYSEEENDFLLENVGKPAIVALKNAHPPNLAATCRPILERVNQLDELKKHEGQEWVGAEAIKDAIRVWKRENGKWREAHRRNRRIPRWPSLYSWDAKGRPHIGGPGSDSGRVRTYFDADGNRKPFALKLVSEEVFEWSPGKSDQQYDSRLVDNGDLNRIECHVRVPDVDTGGFKACGHTESYKTGSRSSYAAARARMSKHLRKSTEGVEEHREVHTNEFGS